MARTKSLLDDVHSEPQQERLASMVNLWYIQRTELNRCGGAVRELASGSKYNTVVCMYMFRTMDDHFGSRTAVVGSQHL
jgi:hypothetical protein